MTTYPIDDVIQRSPSTDSSPDPHHTRRSGRSDRHGLPATRSRRLPERLWEALLRGDDFVTEIPSDRWDADEYYDPEPGVPGRSVSRWGAFIDDVAGFDPEFFGINEREATAMDPQHRLLLETSWEAMEHAGLTEERVADSRTGVFIGLTHGDYQLLAADTRSVEGAYGFSGSNFSLASGRIAYALGVHGPALTVDTACSSGLTAIHLACRSLHEGESDLALAGGAAWRWTRASSPPGRPRACCRPPDAATPSTSRPTGSWAARAASCCSSSG